MSDEWTMSGLGIESVGMLGGLAGGRARGVSGAPSDGAARAGARESFGSGLARALGAGGAEDDGSDRAREAAEELVSAALVRPVLARMRASNGAAGPFAPGLWEKTFGPLVDGEVASRIVRASQLGIVDRIAETLTARGVGVSEREEAGRG